MPFGTFLDGFPSAIFIAAHVAFLVVGAWALRAASQRNLPFAPAISLYVASQVVFLASFAGILALRMSILIEQTLMFVLVIWVTQSAGSARELVSRPPQVAVGGRPEATTGAGR